MPVRPWRMCEKRKATFECLVRVRGAAGAAGSANVGRAPARGQWARLPDDREIGRPLPMRPARRRPMLSHRMSETPDGMDTVILEVVVAATAWTGPTAAAPAPGPSWRDRPQTAEYEACEVVGRRVGGATVRVPWTRVPAGADGVAVEFCVLRGDADAELEFARDAERIVFSLVGSGDAKASAFAFTVRTSSGRAIDVGPAAVHVQPKVRSCRIDVCELFTDPGERIAAVHVRLLAGETPPARRPRLTAAF
jgi:hypothetical protein